MALPSSGVLTLNDIQTEFGGTNPIDLSDYYRGGGLVPNTGPNVGIPTSGVISVTDFYGAANSLPLDFVRRAQFTPSGSATFSNVAIGTPNTNRMVILQSNVQNYTSNISGRITACTIGGITATIFNGSGSADIVYAKVPTGTTATISVSYNNASPMPVRIQVNTINTVNSGPIFQAISAVPNPGTRTFTQNPVNSEGIFMWGYFGSGFAYQSGLTLSTTSAGGVNVVPGYSVYQGPVGSAILTRASMAVSETSNTDSRTVSVTASPGSKGGVTAHAVYFSAN